MHAKSDRVMLRGTTGLVASLLAMAGAAPVPAEEAHHAGTSAFENAGGRCRERGVEVWAYCLMPNHVHLIAVPKSEDALRRAIGEAHRRYTRHVNFREGWRGHLWQGRFASFPLDDTHLYSAVRYVELNPVRAGLARAPDECPWSSAAAHVAGRDDMLVKVEPLLHRFGDWRSFLAEGLSEEAAAALRGHERTGRPLGSLEFVAELERDLGRRLQMQRPARRRKPK